MNMDITEYNTNDDVKLVSKLMKNPLYKIPQHLRDKIIAGASVALSNTENFKEFIDASKLVLEMDKRSLDFMKLFIPKTVRHEHIGGKTTQELQRIVDSHQPHAIPEILQ